MSRTAIVYMHGKLAGTLKETDVGYSYNYDPTYLQTENAQPVSKALPLTNVPYVSNVLFAFFDGLIPEGWLLNLAEQNWKLNERDRFGLLLACCKNCIGAVSITPANLNEEEKD
jgi:serine/threonine-protein kinase HipA